MNTYYCYGTRGCYWIGAYPVRYFLDGQDVYKCPVCGGVAYIQVGASHSD